MTGLDAVDTSIDLLAARLMHANLRIVTAESCTGGLLASALTSHPGSSNWFEGSFVTYRLSAKTRMLDITPVELERYGAVSEHTARRMAQQALQHSDAQLSVAITGLAGPEGDGTNVKVGTLWIAWSGPTASGVERWLETQRFEIHLPRTGFREQSVAYAIEGLMQRLDKHLPA